MIPEYLLPNRVLPPGAAAYEPPVFGRLSPAMLALCDRTEIAISQLAKPSMRAIVSARLRNAGCWTKFDTLRAALGGLARAVPHVTVRAISGAGVAIGFWTDAFGEEAPHAMEFDAGPLENAIDATPEFRHARDAMLSIGGDLLGFERERCLGTAVVAWLPLYGVLDVARTVPDLTGHRVIVVDDDMSMAEVLCDYLCQFGAQAIPACDAGRAAWMASRLDVQTLITDLKMPGTDGYDLACWLRRRPHFDRMRLIALSARAEKESFCRSVACGFDAYLVKPSEPLFLAHAVRADDGAALTQANI